jgi:hypothetical protein
VAELIYDAVREIVAVQNYISKKQAEDFCAMPPFMAGVDATIFLIAVTDYTCQAMQLILEVQPVLFLASYRPQWIYIGADQSFKQFGSRSRNKNAHDG